MLSEHDLSLAWGNYIGVSADHPAATALSAASRVRDVRSGEQVIEQDDISDSVYLVCDGRLSVFRYTQNGHEILLSQIEPVALVGEMSLFASSVRTSAVVASMDSRLIAVSGQNFKALSLAHSVIASAVAQELARRLTTTSNVLTDLVSMSVPNRLYGELVREGRPIAEDNEILVVSPSPAVTTLARRIHATREATSRAMSLLQNRGLVRRTKDLIEIVAPN